MFYRVGEDIQPGVFYLRAMNKGKLALDTETTGLMPYHGDRVFAIVISDGDDSYYFDTENSTCLHPYLASLFSQPGILWFLHNAKFDLHALSQTFGAVPAGIIHDTAVGARLEFNDHLSYSLDSCAKRIGLVKSEEVEKYIRENKLTEKVPIPGKKKKYVKMFFERVPRDIMFRYACQDALVTYWVAEKQLRRIEKVDSLLPEAPRLMEMVDVERSLTPVIWAMERDGVKADLEYSSEAMEFYEQEIKRCEAEFEKLTGKPYKSSPKLFAEVFESERAKWKYTEKGNPSFESDALESFTHPAAKVILTSRNAKSRVDFFSTFAYFADSRGFVHPSFNSGGTATLRFSSSEPNFQNLTNDEEASEERYPVRRAIIPPHGDFALLSVDYDQQEYRMLLDYAGELEVIEAIKSGADVHQAMADMVGVTRKQAKTLNFGLLYGMGKAKLALALGITEDEAGELRKLYFAKLPRVKAFIDRVIGTAERRGYVYNWAGVRYWCEDTQFAYKMPNRIIQGGGSSIMKKAMCELAQVFAAEQAQSRMVITIHDELDFYIHRSEFHLIPRIKSVMESIYPSKHLPLTVSMAHSWKSLGDLVDGPPALDDNPPSERRDSIPHSADRSLSQELAVHG